MKLPEWVPHYLPGAPSSASWVGDTYRSCDNCRYMIQAERYMVDGIGVCDKEDDLSRNLVHFEFGCSRFAYQPELEDSVHIETFD